MTRKLLTSKILLVCLVYVLTSTLSCAPLTPKLNKSAPLAPPKHPTNEPVSSPIHPNLSQDTLTKYPLLKVLQLGKNKKLDSALYLLDLIQVSHPLSQHFKNYFKIKFLLDKGDTLKALYTCDSLRAVPGLPQAAFFNQEYAQLLLKIPSWTPSQFQYASSQVESRLSNTVRAGLILRILQNQDYQGQVGPLDSLITVFFNLNSLPQASDSLYQIIYKAASPGQRNPSTEFALLEYEHKKKLYDRALSRCPFLSNSSVPAPLVQKMRVKHPQIHFEKGDPESALKFIALHDSYYTPHPTLVLLGIKIHTQAQRVQDSLEWSEKYKKLFPETEKTARMLWLSAWEAEDTANFSLALQYHNQIVKNFSHLQRANWSLYRQGIIYFKMGEYKTSRDLFAQAAITEEPASIVSSSLYWIGRCHLALGDTLQAKQVFQETSRKFPIDFYGQEAGRHLSLLGELAPRPQWASPVTAWSRSGFNEYMKGFSSSPSTQLDQIEGPDFKLEHLFTYSYPKAGEHFYKILQRKYGHNPYFQWQYAQILLPYLESESYKLARKLSIHVPLEGWSRVPRPLMELMFPRLFTESVSKHAQKNGISPAFIYAVMRQESAFDPEIRSSAGAIGLMQIIPPTAEMLAKLENISPWSVQQLTQPEINIRLGSRYLSDLLLEYDQKIHWTLTNYNAGPTPTARWRKKLDSLSYIDLVEGISYAETRDYVKKVTANYRVYEMLYGL